MFLLKTPSEYTLIDKNNNFIFIKVFNYDENGNPLQWYVKKYTDTFSKYTGKFIHFFRDTTKVEQEEFLFNSPQDAIDCLNKFINS